MSCYYSKEHIEADMKGNNYLQAAGELNYDFIHMSPQAFTDIVKAMHNDSQTDNLPNMNIDYQSHVTEGGHEIIDHVSENDTWFGNEVPWARHDLFNAQDYSAPGNTGDPFGAINRALYGALDSNPDHCD